MQKIPIGRINNARAGQAFCDYLKSHNINTWLEPEEAVWIIHISDPEVEDYASAELRDFLTNPNDAAVNSPWFPSS